MCLMGFAGACGSSSGDRLSCDDPGIGTPSAIGIDIATGKRAWSWCPGDTSTPIVMGRATGSTVLWQQGTLNELVAIDDNGVELWRHPTSGTTPQAAIGDSTVAVVDNQIVALDALTGTTRWQGDGGKLLAARSGLLLETVGASSIRAVDLLTGAERWTQDVHVGESQYSPTVGNTILAVPYPTTNDTAILDIATGQVLRSDHGLKWAMGDVLVTVDPGSFGVEQLSDAFTGRGLSGSVNGMPRSLPVDAEHDSRGSDLLLVTPRSDGSQAESLQLLDATTGQTRWSVDDGVVSTVTTTQAVVSSTRTIKLLDSATGAILWRYSVRAPSHFVGSVLGTTVVVAVPTNASDD